MKAKWYRIKKAGYSFLISCDVKCSKYKVYCEYTYLNEFGRRYGKIRKFMTYNSIEEMQVDFGGFLDYIEYVEGEEIDDDLQYETTTPDDKR